MRGGARNLVHDWLDGDDLEDLETFVPISPNTTNPDTLPETVIRRTNKKRIDKVREIRRASKESVLNEADEGAKPSAY